MPRADLGHGCSHPGVDIASIRLVWSGYHGQSITAVGTVATINGQVPAYLSLGRAIWMHGCMWMDARLWDGTETDSQTTTSNGWTSMEANKRRVCIP